MRRLKKLLFLSKQTALKILNEENVKSSDFKEVFSEDVANDIITELKSETKKRKRETLLQDINSTKEDDWQKIKPNNPDKGYTHLLKYAAVVVICLSLGYLYVQVDNSTNSVSSKSISAGLPYSDVILDLGNGQKQIISDNTPQETIDSNVSLSNTKNGFSLDYTSNNGKFPEKLVYNELTVPYGRNFQVVLSDGTKIALNSGSSLRYPIHFIKGTKREVYLKGEAFFDVQKNTEQPFLVHTEDMNITVLGTKFNVSSYPEDANINTVLVEGSVAISSNSSKTTTILKPGEKADWNKINKTITTISSVNTSIYTEWINGRAVFEHMPFKNILKKLERRYNVSITNNISELDEEEFTASFDTETIEQVLNSFSKNYQFNYNIQENLITITKQ